MLHILKMNTSLIQKQCHSVFALYGSRLFSRKAFINKKGSSRSTSKKPLKTSTKKVLNYLTNEPHLRKVKALIPTKYFAQSYQSNLKHLYLVDTTIAKQVASIILPFLHKRAGMICETNVGLGLITSELLHEDIEFVRLFEPCSEYREILMDIFKLHRDKVELFAKDIFQLSTLSYVDRTDHGSRIESLLEGVPRNQWKDSPVMTIIGSMPQHGFINYLLRMLAFQSEIITYGRIQLFSFMRPVHFLKLTSKAGDNLRMYQSTSVLFQLFFEWKLLDKYPRKSFLPWEIHKLSKLESIDKDYMYLVQLNLKKVLPTEARYLLHLYYFIKQGFGRGKSRVIPTIEKWFPGIGVNFIVPPKRSHLFKNMSIYTEFGQLTPSQILDIFHELIEQPGYKTSSFIALVDSMVLKTETLPDSEITEKK